MHAIFNSNQIKPSFFLNMSKIIIGFITPVSYNKSFRNRRVINHFLQFFMLILVSRFLNNRIYIYLMIYFIQRIQVKKIITFLTISSREIGIRIIGICCYL